MNITIYHSELVAESRNLINELGIVLNGAEVFDTTYLEHNVKVISKHRLCAEYMPNFSSYPFAVLEINSEKKGKEVKTFQDILDFNTELNAPVIVPVVKPIQYSKLDFLFLFAEEWNSIKEAAKTNSQVSLIFDSFTMADYISMKDERTINSLQYLVSQGLVTQEKFDSILV